jgi:hypothetical protein
MAIKKSGFNIDIDMIPQLFAGIQALSNVHQGATWDVLSGGKTVDQSLGDVANEMKKGAYQDYLDEQEAMLDQFRATGAAMNLEGPLDAVSNIGMAGWLPEFTGDSIDPLGQEGYQLPPWQQGMVGGPDQMMAGIPSDPYIPEQWGIHATQGMSQEESEAIIRMAEQEQAGTGGGFMDFLSGIGTYEDPELGTQFLSPEDQGAFLGPSTVIPPSDYEEYAGDLLAASDQDAEMGLPSGMGFLSQLVNDPATVDIVGIDTYQRFFDTYRDNSSVFDPSLIGDIQKALEEAYILKANVTDAVNQGMFDEANALIEEAYKDPIAPYIPTSSPEDYWNQSMFTEYKPGFIPEPYVAPDYSVTNILDPRTGKIVQTVRDAEGNVVSPGGTTRGYVPSGPTGGTGIAGDTLWAGGAFGTQDEDDIFEVEWAATPGVQQYQLEQMKPSIKSTAEVLYSLMLPDAHTYSRENPIGHRERYRQHINSIMTKGYAGAIKELGSVDNAISTLVENFRIAESGAEESAAYKNMTDQQRLQYTTHLSEFYDNAKSPYSGFMKLVRYLGSRGLPEGFDMTSGAADVAQRVAVRALANGQTPYQVISSLWSGSGSIDSAPAEASKTQGTPVVSGTQPTVTETGDQGTDTVTQTPSVSDAYSWKNPPATVTEDTSSTTQTGMYTGPDWKIKGAQEAHEQGKRQRAAEAARMKQASGIYGGGFEGEPEIAGGAPGAPVISPEEVELLDMFNIPIEMYSRMTQQEKQKVIRDFSSFPDPHRMIPGFSR